MIANAFVVCPYGHERQRLTASLRTRSWPIGAPDPESRRGALVTRDGSRFLPFASGVLAPWLGGGGGAEKGSLQRLVPVIVVGHTRYKAALKLGLKTVPVHVAADLSPQQARAS